MSVFRQKDRRAYTYEFQYQGNTYKGSTGQLTKEDAEAFEFQEQRRVRRRAAGIADLRDAPPFQEWAGVYYTHKAESKWRVKRPEQIDVLVRIVLRFFGRRPTTPDAAARADTPYHDLTLADPILEPAWLDRFEDWMEAHAFSGSHRNHLRTQVSGMYKLAQRPRYRKVTGIGVNPMEGVPRDRRVVRTVSLTQQQIAAWMGQASYHVRLAMAIAALAPKLRVGNVLALEWAVHLDRHLTRITVTDHKTDASGRPLVAMIGTQLRDILKDARRRNTGRFVVTYRGRRVKQIRDGVRRAAERAGLIYGRDTKNGVTFHTIRHAVATWLAEMDDLSEPMRAALLAHADIRTTQGYTHLRPILELAPMQRVSARLKIAKIVKAPWRRWTKRRGQETGGLGPSTEPNGPQPRASAENAAEAADHKKRSS